MNGIISPIIKTTMNRYFNLKYFHILIIEFKPVKVHVFFLKTSLKINKYVLISQLDNYKKDGSFIKEFSILLIIKKL